MIHDIDFVGVYYRFTVFTLVISNYIDLLKAWSLLVGEYSYVGEDGHIT